MVRKPIHNSNSYWFKGSRYRIQILIDLNCTALASLAIDLSDQHFVHIVILLHSPSSLAA
jgi:hypothetical protein